MENSSNDVRLLRRECGGWLAVAGPNESIKIGVTAETEEKATAEFNEAIAAWRETLQEAVAHG